MSDYQRVEHAIRYLEKNHLSRPSLSAVAKELGLSPFHFQRLFSRWAGVSPNQFLQCLTVAHAKKSLLHSQSVLDAALESGLSSVGHLHHLFVKAEAMSPGEFKTHGFGLVIEYGTAATPFGPCAVAVTARGVCALEFLSEAGVFESTSLFECWKMRWSGAQFVRSQLRAKNVCAKLFLKSGANQKSLELKALLAGTPFQIKVWQALLRIPPGSVTSYQALAKSIGAPKAARAVGSAVAANAIAVLIPCHRVIRDTGVIGEYRWGGSRKKALLALESCASEIEADLEDAKNHRR